MRALKIVGIVLSACIVLVAVALVSVRLFVNPNDFKGRIEQLVKRSTGRELTLNGPMHLAVFPWIALELGPASLGNPPGFPAQPFLSVKRIALRVKLLPLLSKRLEIGRIEVDGLNVRLEKNAQGRGNWTGFTGSSTPQGASSASSSSLPALAKLAGIQIRNARIQYQTVVADHIDLSVGRVGSGAAVPIHLAFELSAKPGAKPVALDARLLATLDSAEKRYGLTSVRLKGTYAVKAGAPAVPWQIAAPAVHIDLAAQTVAAPTVTVELASVRLTNHVRATHILNAPMIEDSFTLAPVTLRKLLAHLHYALPATRDPRAFSTLAASGRLAYGSGAARISDLDVKLDDSTLRGSAAITNLTTKASRFNLAIDHIDLDRYLAAKTSHPASAPARPGTPATPAPLPTKLLRSLKTTGNVRIGSATLAGIRVRNVDVGLEANGGLLHIAPVRAELYGGRYKGDLRFDVRGSTPAATFNQRISNIDVAQLLADFAKTRRLSGRGDVTTQLTAHGRTAKAMLASLDGHVTANLKNGAVEGFDLGFEVGRAIALITKHTLPAGSDNGRTAFETFRASADLHNGIATTHDLKIASRSLQVTGGGTANLVTDAIDYHVKARLLGGSAGGTSAALIDVPVLITGTLSSPKVRPNLAGLAESLLRQQLRTRKGQLQHQLLNRLKGLFK